jgi:hypothetical protein
VVWSERPGGGSDDVTLNLSKARAAVKTHDPTSGTAPTQTLTSVSSVVFTRSDHPEIVEITP